MAGFHRLILISFSWLILVSNSTADTSDADYGGYRNDMSVQGKCVVQVDQEDKIVKTRTEVERTGSSERLERSANIATELGHTEGIESTMIPMTTPPVLLISHTREEALRRRQDIGQIQVLSGQIRFISQVAQQFSQSVQQLQQSTGRLSRSVQQLQESAQQAQQSVRQAQESARQATEAAAAASQSADQAVSSAEASAKDSASLAIASVTKSAAESASSLLAAASTSAQGIMRSASSQVQAAHADATLAQANAATRAEQAHGSGISFTQAAIAIVGTFIGSSLLTVLIFYLVLGVKRKRKRRRRRQPSGEPWPQSSIREVGDSGNEASSGPYSSEA